MVLPFHLRNSFFSAYTFDLEPRLQLLSFQLEVPILLIDPALPLQLQDLEARFRNAVLGQEEAINSMVQMISLIKSGLSDMRRPFGALDFHRHTKIKSE